MGPGGAFVRTSGMSPKDAFIYCTKIREELRMSVLDHMKKFPTATQEEQVCFECYFHSLSLFP